MAPAVTAAVHRQVKKMRTQQYPPYSTQHLYLAAYLTCAGHEIIGTSSVGGRVSFEFTQTPQLSNAVANFMSDAMVPARQFSFELLKLKRLIPRKIQTVEKNYKDANAEIPRYPAFTPSSSTTNKSSIGLCPVRLACYPVVLGRRWPLQLLRGELHQTWQTPAHRQRGHERHDRRHMDSNLVGKIPRSQCWNRNGSTERNRGAGHRPKTWW